MTDRSLHPKGLTFVADRDEFVREQRRSLVRVATASALAAVRKQPAKAILKAEWPDDHHAEIYLRAATAPTDTAGFPAISGVTTLQRLAPASVALQVFSRALAIDLDGIASVKVPFVATPPAVSFIGEGQPAPVVQFATSTMTVGPARKLLVLASTTAELEGATPQAASNVIGAILADAIAKAVDTVAFGTAAGDAIKPPGLLFGVTPLTPAAGGGVNAMAEDIAALAAAIANSGIDANSMIVVASTKQAVKLKLLAGPAFADVLVLGSAVIPAGTVIGIAPSAVACAYRGAPEISSSIETSVHFETSPLPIVDGGNMAAPVRSAFQQDLICIRVRAWTAWDKIAGGVQVINSITW